MNPIPRSLAVTLLAAATLSGGPVFGQPHGSGHGFHVPMPNQELLLRCTFARGGETVTAEHPFKPPSTMTPADIDLAVALAGDAPPLRIRQYLPQARRSQSVAPAEGMDGKPAIHVSITGRKQAFDRWLIADNPLRNRLSSLIGTWRYMAVDSGAERDELYQQFEQELTRPAQVLIAADDADAPATLPARAGERYTDTRSSQTLTVLKFLPHFGMDRRTQQAVNQSDKRINPAVLIELEHQGEKEQHWLFAKFPEFKAHGDVATPLRMRLDCPIETQRAAPDMVIVTVGRTRHEVWIRYQGAITSEPAALNQAIAVPGSNYGCTIEEFTASGRLLESYDMTTDRKAVTALRVDVPNAAGSSTPAWLELNKPRVVDSPLGALTLTFASRQAASPGGH